MNIRTDLTRVLLPLALGALPLVLLYTSLRTFHELDEQRAVYLRHRVSIVAGRLENLPAGATPESLWEALSEVEPNLRDIAVISRGSAQDTAALAGIWDGRELFRTGFERDAGGRYRAYVPFHSSAGLRIARIDLDPAAADFLLVHARHNVIVASLGGIALFTLSVYSVWEARRAARLRLRQLQVEHLAQLGKMAAVMAHEIRNPLGAIKGFVQLAGERADPVTRELLKPAVAQTERLERLVRDLLAYARPATPAPALVNWQDLAAVLEAHGRELIGARPVALHIARCDFAFETDAALFEQILLNLLRNAVEAIPPGESGEVRVDVEARASRLAISVLDTGAGLTDAAAARIFEPFFTTKPFGTGLGLATARGLARSLGGDLELHRRDRGGACAVVRFTKVASVPEGALS